MTTKTMTAADPENATASQKKIGPKIKTALPGPNALRVLAGDQKYISPSYTRSYPMVAKSGRGIVVTDVDGNEFYDFSAGIAVTSTGHCHPEVVAAIQKQAGELIHMSGTDFYYEESGARSPNACRRSLPCLARTRSTTATRALKPSSARSSSLDIIQKGKTLLRFTVRFMDAPWARCR